MQRCPKLLRRGGSDPPTPPHPEPQPQAPPSRSSIWAGLALTVCSSLTQQPFWVLEPGLAGGFDPSQTSPEPVSGGGSQPSAASYH